MCRQEYSTHQRSLATGNFLIQHSRSDNSYEGVKSQLQTILDELTRYGDAWQPVEDDTFDKSILSSMTRRLRQSSLDDSSSGEDGHHAFMYNATTNISGFRMYVKN